MLAKRIIPCLDVRDGHVVKGVQFRNHEIIGDIVPLAKRYAEEGADELVFYDITASSDGRVVDKSWVSRVAEVIDIPFCVAGGIKSLEDAAMLREKFFRPSSADSREGVGADIAWDNGLRDDDVLLVPPPFDSLYPHYLCAMTDAALGENDRYAGEQAQYNSILAELAAWLRRKNLPARGCSWRW